MLIVFDNVNILMNACYSKNELDFVEVMNELLNHCERDPKVSLVLVVNRDLFDEESELVMNYYRDYKNTVFD